MLVPWGRGGGLLGRRVDGATFAWGAVVVLPEGRDLIDLGIAGDCSGDPELNTAAVDRLFSACSLSCAVSLRKTQHYGVIADVVTQGE